MKTFLLFIGMLLSIHCISQAIQQPISQSQEPINRKSIKACLAFAGGNIMAGAIISTIKTYRTEPGVFADQRKIDRYTQNQKDLSRTSAMFYGFGGLSLVCICFNF